MTGRTAYTRPTKQTSRHRPEHQRAKGEGTARAREEGTRSHLIGRLQRPTRCESTLAFTPSRCKPGREMLLGEVPQVALAVLWRKVGKLFVAGLQRAGANEVLNEVAKLAFHHPAVAAAVGAVQDLDKRDLPWRQAPSGDASQRPGCRCVGGGCPGRRDGRRACCSGRASRCRVLICVSSRSVLSHSRKLSEGIEAARGHPGANRQNGSARPPPLLFPLLSSSRCSGGGRTRSRDRGHVQVSALKRDTFQIRRKRPLFPVVK